MQKSKSPKLAPELIAYRRKSIDKNREKRHLMQGEEARHSVGELYSGCEIFGLTKGQFSSINLIEECLNQTGSADVTIATWTTAHAEIKKAEAFLHNGLIRSLRFLVDRSFPNRQPEYCRSLIETFGEDSIRATRTHAKFITIRNEEWDLVIRSSMNLNENRRIEIFEISDDKGMAEYLDGIVDMLYTDPLDWTASNFSAFGGVSKDEQKIIRDSVVEEGVVDSGNPDFDMDFDI